MNFIRLYTLIQKETHRFFKVWMQTITSPVMVAVLYFSVFGAALSSKIVEFSGIPYIAFIVPGLALLQSTNNAFQNPSSSMIQAKYSDTITDIQMSPLTPLEKTLGYSIGGIIRGVLVALCIFAVAWVFIEDFAPKYWGLAFLSIFLANAVFAFMGLLVGIWSKTFDHVAGLMTFIITPMGFLGGVFYAISSLPTWAQTASLFNPFLYFVESARYAFFGISDISPFISFGVSGGLFLAFGLACYIAFKINWRMED